MNTKLTWKQIKKKFPNKWVSVLDPKIDHQQGMTSGTVIASHLNKEAVIKKTKKLREEGLHYSSHIYIYTGEIPYLVGTAKLAIKNVQTRMC